MDQLQASTIWQDSYQRAAKLFERGMQFFVLEIDRLVDRVNGDKGLNFE